jgi:YidC/Oxa1 family membrane protein insertase
MDQQRPFLYLSLFFLGFLIWSTWQQDHAPKAPPPAKTDIVNSDQLIPSISSIPDQTAQATSGENSTLSNKTVNPTESTLVHIKTDVLDLHISSLGANIVQAELPTFPVSLKEKDKAVRILDKEKGYVAQSGLRHQDVNGVYQSDLAPNHYANFSVEKKEYVLADGQNTIIVPLRWTNEKGVSVVKTFFFERGKFLIKQTQQVNNQSGQNWVASQYLQITHAEHIRKGSLLAGDVAYTGAAYYNDKYIKVSFSDIENENLNDPVKGGWAAMIEHYFVSAWIPPVDSLNSYYSIFDKAKKIYIIGVKTPPKVINSGETDTFDSQFYVGPTDQDELAAISKGLDLTVDYGIFAFVSKPIFYVMNIINKYIVSNWGWTIILLTMFIKLIFFYPSAVSYRSMAKMKKLGPKIKEISEKYKNDPQAKQKETMAFYRKEKINPLGGCLPMLIQMPVFMGLYWVLQESVELRQAPWILWYKDLSIKDPYFILPLIMGASMFIQQKLNPPAVQDPMQQKIFTYLPVVFTVMFLFFPAGLVLYWVVNNILSIFQQWFINKKIIGDG